MKKQKKNRDYPKYTLAQRRVDNRLIRELKSVEKMVFRIKDLVEGWDKVE